MHRPTNFTAFISGEWYHQNDAAGILTLDGGASIDPATGKQTTTAGIITTISPVCGQAGSRQTRAALTRAPRLFCSAASAAPLVASGPML